MYYTDAIFFFDEKIISGHFLGLWSWKKLHFLSWVQNFEAWKFFKFFQKNFFFQNALNFLSRHWNAFWGHPWWSIYVYCCKKAFFYEEKIISRHFFGLWSWKKLHFLCGSKISKHENFSNFFNNSFFFQNTLNYLSSHSNVFWRHPWWSISVYCCRKALRLLF